MASLQRLRFFSSHVLAPPPLPPDTLPYPILPIHISEPPPHTTPHITRHPPHPYGTVPYRALPYPSLLQSYTQYIPLSVHQLKDWAGTPAIFVLDCSAAGVLLRHFVEPQLPMEEGDDVFNPDTPPRGDGGGVGPGAGFAGSAGGGDGGGAPSDMGELYGSAVFVVSLLFFAFVSCCV